MRGRRPTRAVHRGWTGRALPDLLTQGDAWFMGTPTRAPAYATGDRMIGRRRELDALRACLDDARDGGGRLMVCVGEPGIGKTRLAQELAGIALASGTGVAWGRCVEARGGPAFWPWRQVLRTLGVDPNALLAGEVESPEDRFRVIDDVTEAVRGVADKSGLVVILDDIHRGDEPSLLVLRHLADQIAGTRLLVFAACRDVGPASDASRLLPDLLRSPAAERLELRGFDLARCATNSRARHRRGRPQTRVPCLTSPAGTRCSSARSSGLDARGLVASRPATKHCARHCPGARLDRVSADCRRLVQTAAIIGRDFSIDARRGHARRAGRAVSSASSTRRWRTACSTGSVIPATSGSFTP